MVDDDLELEEDLGEATIVYEGTDGDPVEKTVPNEHVAYFQDHWIVKTDEDDRGNDVVRRIPGYRVYYVERSVEEFEREVETLLDRVESVARGLQTKIPIGGSGDPSGGGREEPHRIDIETGASDDFETGASDESGD